MKAMDELEEIFRLPMTILAQRLRDLGFNNGEIAAMVMGYQIGRKLALEKQEEPFKL